MNTRTAHLRNIATHRFDRLPRLVYADYLEEQCTDADTLTAEFIRVGVALAEGVDVHRPSVTCDCDRCKLVRRQTELFDLMAHVPIIGESGYKPSGIECEFTPAHYSGGFPVIAHCIWGFADRRELPLAVGRLFLALPVNFMAVAFDVYGGRPVRRERWMITAAITGSTSTRGQRVTATVGPNVGSGGHTTFTCEYPVDHASRVPTLVRKAVRRCLTNRTSNSERMGTVPVSPPPPARLVPTVHPIMRRRSRR